MNRPVSHSLLASRNFLIKNQSINAYGIGKLRVQQLLQRLINLSPYEDKVFSLKFPSLTPMMTHMPFLYMFRFAIRV